jgi:ribonucleoside-diphosphate reductase alpha chain
VIPFYKYFQSAVKSCSQGGTRAGAATLYYPIWHLEVEDLLVLKNNKGTEDNRIRHMDYGVQFNKVMYERLLSGGNITLFSPHDVPDMYEAFFVDVEKFKELYEKYEHSTKIRKKIVPAIELFGNFMQERKDTGRIYLMNVDHVNDHSSFIKEKAPIRQSNLCAEIALPTKPLNSINDPKGEISLCTLAAVNWGKIKDLKDFERICPLVVRALDELLDYQDYPILAAELSTMNRRPLGVGIINLAYWLAKHDFTYQGITSEGLAKLHEYAEAWSYNLIKASVDLAKEIGACPKNSETKYSQGIMPIDTYKRDVDELVPPVYKQDWNSLKADAIKYGIRNSTLMALMPSETSAQTSNSTNGVEPPRSLISIKQSKDGVLKQVVPEIRRLKNKYDLLWDQRSPIGYLKICAVLQKFIDQCISVNTSYNPKYYPDDQIPMSEMLQHLLLHYKWGGKTLYYYNTADGAGEVDIKHYDVVQTDEGICESCTI